MTFTATEKTADALAASLEREAAWAAAWAAGEAARAALEHNASLFAKLENPFDKKVRQG